MNGYVIYCNSCYTNSFSANQSLQQYFITSCGKVICQKCLPSQANCNKCGPNCSRKLISNQMGSDMDMFFKDIPSNIKRMLQAEMFQQNRYKQFIKYQYQQIISLKRMVQEQANQLKGSQEKQSGLEAMNRKLQENLKYFQQLYKQSRHSQAVPAATIGPIKQNSFFSNVMNAIEQNDSMISQGNSGIFPRENLSRNSFDRSIRNGINVGKANLMPKTVTFDPNFNNVRLLQSTPLAGHEQQVPSFGYRNGGPSNLPSDPYPHRPRPSSRRYH